MYVITNSIGHVYPETYKSPEIAIHCFGSKVIVAGTGFDLIPTTEETLAVWECYVRAGFKIQEIEVNI